MDRTAILYDADCGFCRWSAARILAWDRRGRLRPVALQSEEAESLLPGLDRAQRMESWHLATPEGRRYDGGAAIAPLLRLLPGGRPFAAVASAFPGATETAYRWVARHRGRLGGVVGARGTAVDPGRRS